MKLPEIATRLRQLALELNCGELKALAEEIPRRPAGPRAPATSAPMTEALRRQIKAMKEANPLLPQAEIGKRLNVNPGRVSETLKGKRV